MAKWTEKIRQASVLRGSWQKPCQFSDMVVLAVLVFFAARWHQNNMILRIWCSLSFPFSPTINPNNEYSKIQYIPCLAFGTWFSMSIYLSWAASQSSRRAALQACTVESADLPWPGAPPGQQLSMVFTRCLTSSPRPRHRLFGLQALSISTLPPPPVPTPQWPVGFAGL